MDKELAYYRELYKKYNQGHIFEYENEWTDDDKKQILSDFKTF